MNHSFKLYTPEEESYSSIWS